MTESQLDENKRENLIRMANDIIYDAHMIIEYVIRRDPIVPFFTCSELNAVASELQSILTEAEKRAMYD